MISRKISRNNEAATLQRMRFAGRVRGTGLAMALVLAACAPIQQRPLATGSEAMQQAREAELAKRSVWAFTGRLAVSQGSNGGNARVQWHQVGSDFDIKLLAPITRQSWRLRQTAGKASLEGLDGGVREGENAELLLLEATGWRIPVTSMSTWVRGMRASGSSDIGFDEHGLPAAIKQGGWTVEYRAWFPRTPPLPEKVFARQGEASVRLVVETWDHP